MADTNQKTIAVPIGDEALIPIINTPYGEPTHHY